MYVLGAACCQQIQMHKKPNTELNSTLSTFSGICPWPNLLISPDTCNVVKMCLCSLTGRGTFNGPSSNHVRLLGLKFEKKLKFSRVSEMGNGQVSEISCVVTALRPSTWSTFGAILVIFEQDKK